MTLPTAFYGSLWPFRHRLPCLVTLSHHFQHNPHPLAAQTFFIAPKEVIYSFNKYLQFNGNSEGHQADPGWPCQAGLSSVTAYPLTQQAPCTAQRKVGFHVPGSRW
jgi:hypothetical protein